MSEKDEVVTGSWRKEMSTLLKIVSALFALLVGLLILLFILRPPGEPQKQPMEPDASPGSEVLMDSGTLPGITWMDDIHPIFVRNKWVKEEFSGVGSFSHIECPRIVEIKNQIREEKLQNRCKARVDMKKPEDFGKNLT